VQCGLRVFSSADGEEPKRLRCAGSPGTDPRPHHREDVWHTPKETPRSRAGVRYRGRASAPGGRVSRGRPALTVPLFLLYQSNERKTMLKSPKARLAVALTTGVLAAGAAAAPVATA